MKRLFFAAIVFAALHAAPAYADDGIVGGAGAFTCSEFGKEYQTDPESEHMFFTWAQGFMSGMNAAGGFGHVRDLGSKPVVDQEEFLRKYCDDHPLSTYAVAVSKLYVTLKTH
ncbi:MAG TPA: hypothetical protein VL625_12275 [Patescibacteria group bacterium]|nr:hypothetical protein [Patescibacteria group bacterium]